MKKPFRIIVILISVSLFLTVGCFFVGREILKNRTVISTQNYKVSRDMLNYCTGIQKEEYISHYTNLYGEEYLQTVGLNPKKSLKSQKSSYGGTWFEYFYSLAIDDIKEILPLCEAAAENGIALSDDEMKQLQAKSEENRDYSSETVFSVLKLKATANKYKQTFFDSLSYSEKDYDEFYNENRKSFDCVDYKYIEIKADIDANSENADASLNEAKQKAENLAEKIKSVGFENAVSEYSSVNNSEVVTVKEYAFEERTQFGQWAFDGEREDGDVIIFEGNRQYSVYYLEKAPYKLDYSVRQVQMISFSLNADSDSAVTSIYSLIDTWRNEENTVENFTELSEDVCTKPAYKAEISTNLYDWVYSDKREVGDYEIIEDNSNLALVRYSGESGSYFRLKAYEQMSLENYNEALESYSEKYEMKVKE